MFAEINKEAFSFLPVVLNTIGQSPRQGHVDHTVSPLRHHEFIWITDGEGHFEIEDSEFTLCKGEGVFIRKGVLHQYKITEKSDIFFTSWLTFSLSEAVLDQLGVGRYLRFSVPSFLESERSALDRFASGDSTVFSRSSAVYSFVFELFSALLPISEKLEDRVHRFLENRYSEPLTLDMIANEVGSDRFALCRYYAKNCQKSVMDELLEIRIAKAKRFLKYTAESVSQIGRMCGFESHSYFSKRFKEICGKTPAEYRSN